MLLEWVLYEPTMLRSRVSLYALLSLLGGLYFVWLPVPKNQMVPADQFNFGVDCINHCQSSLNILILLSLLLPALVKENNSYAQHFSSYMVILLALIFDHTI